MSIRLRRRVKRFAAIAAFLLASMSSFAAGLPATSRAEIDSLLAVLGSSDCEFYRNGSWYGAVQAQDHLRTKYEYLLRQGRIASADEFIAAAGTRSSISGQAYQVRCPHQEPQESAIWLGNALHRIREAGVQ